MRALKSLIGMATLALTASLVGCGGGGDAGAPLTPTGILVVSGSPLNGTIEQDTSNTQGDPGLAEFHFLNSASNEMLYVEFDESTGAVSLVQFNGTVLGATPYECEAGTATPCSGMSVNTTARTITFNGSTLKTGSNTLTLRGTLDLTLPPA